jgi:alanyl-tRNA synthetase
MKFLQTGITTDNKICVSNVYRFYETEGLPLEVIFDLLKNHNMIPDWIEFVKEASAAGMTKRSILSKLEEAILDSYGKEFKDHIIKELEILIPIVINRTSV